MLRQFSQDSFASGGETYVHFTTVFPALAARDEPLVGKPVHEFNRTVMLNLEPLRQIGDARPSHVGAALNGQHQLVMLRFQPHFPSGSLAEVQEAAKLVAKLGQGMVVRQLQVIVVGHGRVNTILSFHEIYWKGFSSTVWRLGRSRSLCRRPVDDGKGQ